MLATGTRLHATLTANKKIKLSKSIDRSEKQASKKTINMPAGNNLNFSEEALFKLM